MLGLYHRLPPQLPQQRRPDPSTLVLPSYAAQDQIRYFFSPALQHQHLRAEPFKVLADNLSDGLGAYDAAGWNFGHDTQKLGISHCWIEERQHVYVQTEHAGQCEC